MKRPNGRLKGLLVLIVVIVVVLWSFNTVFLQGTENSTILGTGPPTITEEGEEEEGSKSLLGWAKFLEPVCEHHPHEEERKVEKVEMAMDTEHVDHKDPQSLIQFCAPYKYSRLQLEWQDSPTPGCAVGDKVRGTDCSWYHMCIWDPMEDIYISKAIAEGNLWESFFVLKMVSEAKDKDKGIIIDAGANIGQYTILGAALGHTVYSFEPIPSHIEMMKKSVALNGWSDRVHLYQNGLGDYRASTHILAHSFNKGGATIQNLNTSAAPPEDGRYNQKIPLNLIMLDDVLPDMKKYSPKQEIVFWKADVEGYESRMFRGAVKVLEYYKPQVIAFEILGKSFAFTKCKLYELLSAISQMGYNIYDLKSDTQLAEKDFASKAKTLTENKKDMDVILRPKEKPTKQRPETVPPQPPSPKPKPTTPKPASSKPASPKPASSKQPPKAPKPVATKPNPRPKQPTTPKKPA